MAAVFGYLFFHLVVAALGGGQRLVPGGRPDVAVPRQDVGDEPGEVGRDLGSHRCRPGAHVDELKLPDQVMLVVLGFEEDLHRYVLQPDDLHVNDVSDLRFFIRDMAADEADAVAAVLAASNREHLEKFPPEVARSYRTELVDVSARLAVSDIVVAEVDGEIRGTATLVRDAADDGHPWPPGGSVLRLLAVDPALRRLGVGSRLAETCVQRAELRGARFVGLHTAPFMEAARALYQRMGFQRRPQHDFDPDAHYGSAPTAAGEPWGHAYVLDLPRPSERP